MSPRGMARSYTAGRLSPRMCGDDPLISAGQQSPLYELGEVAFGLPLALAGDPATVAADGWRRGRPGRRTAHREQRRDQVRRDVRCVIEDPRTAGLLSHLPGTVSASVRSSTDLF